MNKTNTKVESLNKNSILDSSEVRLLNSLLSWLDKETKKQIENDLSAKYSLDQKYSQFADYLKSTDKITVEDVKSKLWFHDKELVGVIQFVLNLYGYKEMLATKNNPSWIDWKFWKKTYAALKDFVSKRWKIDYVESKKQTNEWFDLILELDSTKPISQTQQVRLEWLFQDLQKDKSLRNQVMNNLLWKFKIDSKLKELVWWKTRKAINMESVQSIFGWSKDNWQIAALQMYVYIADFVNWKKHKNPLINWKLDSKTLANLKNNIFNAPLYADLMLPDINNT